MEKIDPLKIAKASRDMDAKEIVRFFYSHGPKFWSWGANKFTDINKRGLRFTVNAHHHKGHVYLFVNGSDLFDIYLTTSHGNIKEKICDIYLDQLVDVIDRKIEWIDVYDA